MQWTKVKTLFDSEAKALKAAQAVETTEARLANQHHGPQYRVETIITQEGETWQVYWRKVFVGFNAGCGGGCGACDEETPAPKEGKVIPFKKK